MLYNDPAHCFRNRKDQDQGQENGSDPFQHDPVELFNLEGTVKFHFILNNLGSDKMPHADTGENSHNRHEHTVADEVKEIQQSQSQKLDKAQRSEAQRDDGSQYQDIDGDQYRGFFCPIRSYPAEWKPQSPSGR